MINYHVQIPFYITIGKTKRFRANCYGWYYKICPACKQSNKKSWNAFLLQLLWQRCHNTHQVKCIIYEWVITLNILQIFHHSTCSYLFCVSSIRLKSKLSTRIKLDYSHVGMSVRDLRQILPQTCEMSKIRRPLHAIIETNSSNRRGPQ